jgi:hypothetical protein
VSRVLAKSAWVIPIILFLLTLHQALVTYDLGVTIRDGERMQAKVTQYHRVDRKDVTQADIDLKVVFSDGTVLEKHRMSLPYTIAHRVEKDSLEVYVLPGSRQEVVIASISGTQRRIALSNAVMAGIMFLIAGVGVYFWNRYQARNPD